MTQNSEIPMARALSCAPKRRILVPVLFCLTAISCSVCFFGGCSVIAGALRYMNEVNVEASPPQGLKRYHNDTAYKVRWALNPGAKSLVAVLSFTGDIHASGVNEFGKLVDEVVFNKDRFKEVVLVLDSPGGEVAAYGQVAAQVERLRNATPKLTVCVDRVAASGGYLAAMPAHHIVAAPFSYVGSVGVIAFVPNLRQAAEKLGIEPRVFVAGRNKSPVSYFDDNDPNARQSFQDRLESIHEQMLAQLIKYRPGVNKDEVKTASVWTAQDSVEKNLGLVDAIGTSNGVLMSLNQLSDLVIVSRRLTLAEEFHEAFSAALQETVAKALTTTELFAVSH